MRSLLGIRLVLVTLLVVAIGIAATGKALVTQLRGAISTQLDQQGLALAKASAVHCVEPVLSRDYPVLEELARNMTAGGYGVRSFAVLSKEGDELARVDAPRDDSPIRVYEEPISLSEGGDGPMIVGRVVLALSEGMMEGVEERQHGTLLLAGFLLFVSLSVAIYACVLAFLARPLTTLRKEVIAVQGDLNHEVTIRGNGELEQVALAVEDLRLRVLASHEGLEARRRAVERLSSEKDVMLRELEDAMRTARQADRLKMSFLANTSHELRTPLNGILGMAELLSEADLAERERSWLDSLQTSGQALLRVIDDVFDIALLEAGELELAVARIDVRSTVLQAAAQARVVAVRKGLRLSYEIDPGTPPTVLGDARRVLQALSKLVDNAVKFTESGSVQIRVTRVPNEEEDPGEITLALEVQDTGRGVPEEHMEQILQPFRQADDSSTRVFGGTGLGLAIVRQVAIRMGGCLRVQSRVGVGSTFRLELPLRVDGDAVPLRDAKARGRVGTEIHGLRVLVVDDNPVNRRLACAVLQNLGASTEVASNGLEAVESALEKRPDVILMDCQMPELDGLEATREIRREEESMGAARIPILAWTANALPGESDDCRDAGMDGYVTKPIRKGQLVKAMRSLLPNAPPPGRPLPEPTADSSNLLD